MGEGIDTWPELVALLLILLIGPSGLVLIVVTRVMARHEKRDDEKAAERAEVSVDLHRRVFDDAMQGLHAELSAKIDRTVAPLADRQIRHDEKLDDIGKDVRGLRADVGELRGADRDLHERLAAVERRAS